MLHAECKSLSMHLVNKTLYQRSSSGLRIDMSRQSERDEILQNAKLSHTQDQWLKNELRYLYLVKVWRVYDAIL